MLWSAQVVYVPFSRSVHPCCFGARLQNCSLSCLCICGVLLYHLGLSPVWTHLLMAFSTDGQWRCVVREPEAAFAKTEHNKLCPNSERIRKTPVRQGRAGNQLRVWHTAQGPGTKEKVKEELTQMNISNQGVINLASFQADLPVQHRFNRDGLYCTMTLSPQQGMSWKSKRGLYQNLCNFLFFFILTSTFSFFFFLLKKKKKKKGYIRAASAQGPGIQTHFSWVPQSNFSLWP